MTEEKFNELLKLKEEINKLERNLKTIDYLLKSTNLNIEITGISECEFKVCRYLTISNEDMIRYCLFNEQISLTNKLNQLNKEFELK